MFLTGDFNAYSEEDPIQVLEGRATRTSSPTPPARRATASPACPARSTTSSPTTAALADVEGVDIWDINASESIAYQYSRLQLQRHRLLRRHDAVRRLGPQPGDRRASTRPTPSTRRPVDVQILGTNDFHGRILNNTNNEAGAAVLAGCGEAVARGRTPNTVFAAAGDLIGASTFESFIQKDKPTIDALNAAGLEVSAVGNHEFDQGYDDLVNRVMEPYDATTNPFGGAKWQYIAANVRHKEPTTRTLCPRRWTTDRGRRQGRLRRRGDRGPSVPGQPRRHRGHRR